MKCSEFRNNVLFYIENSISQEQKEMFDKHLIQCDSCRLFYDNIQLSYSSLGNNRIKVDGDVFYNNVMSSLKQSNESEGKLMFLSQYRHVLQMAGVFIVGAFAVLLGYLIADDIEINDQNIVKDANNLTDIELLASEQQFDVSTDDIYYLSVNESE